eukprot:CAMPEP_0173403286 /NCGR_PEP_ID=MMETSP1356-20130122/56377_1 /TAXON_ID=77927 ORGANISM="Hemiselmis virescens, Strain PCC157" /NCGR_SAMPLE_ID=MMETSP1356 /ASSEMBLY_ACC=CAM_ASM_000847 /LENGTH=62 /DNA_ID=CAMNT_0014363791 /DNA_START=58 /DNA_END=243 /DNA_ORIENTATION=+
MRSEMNSSAHSVSLPAYFLIPPEASSSTSLLNDVLTTIASAHSCRTCRVRNSDALAVLRSTS